MAPRLSIDLSQVDLTAVAFDTAAVEAVNPHRGDMRLIDHIIWTDEQYTQTIACKHVKDDEFWVAGHIPGRPIFPGVLMIEAAAQLASFMAIKRLPEITFLGFAGVDGVKFRGQVGPGDTLHFLATEIQFKKRRFICGVQGVVDGNLVFEAKITGMPL